jgi:hypothetical protein
MSKKKLLEERAVRKMMKYANIGKLADGFISENYGTMYEEDPEMDLPPEPEDVDPVGMEDEMPAEEEGAMGEAGKEELLAQVVQAVADTLGVEAEVEGAGEEMGMEGGPDDFVPVAADEAPSLEAPEGEEEEEMVEEEMVEEEMVEEGVSKAGDIGRKDQANIIPDAGQLKEEEVVEEEEVIEEDEEVVEGVEVMMDEESIVQETVKRVTARLKAMKEAKKKEDLVESITNRIIDALRSKK